METNASLSGWTSASTMRFIGFSERVMSDLEIIIQNFYGLPKVQAMMKFHEDLRAHLYQTPDDHDLDISPWHDRLVKQLYKTYRLSNHVGSVKDMLFAIDKVIDIAKHVDVTAGYTTTRAVDLGGWRWLFDKHATERLSHYAQFDHLQPSEVLNLYPGFSFSHFIKENFDEYKTSGYPIDSWNDSNGTILVDIHYDFSEVGTAVQQYNILSLEFLSVSFLIRLIASAGKFKCQGYVVNKATGAETLLFTTKLPVDPIGYTPLLLVYTDKLLTIRDLLSNTTIGNPFSGSPYKLKLFRPLGETGTSIREITYYREAATQAQQLFFLQ